MPWSTWAMMATFRMSLRREREERMVGTSAAVDIGGAAESGFAGREDGSVGGKNGRGEAVFRMLAGLHRDDWWEQRQRRQAISTSAAGKTHQGRQGRRRKQLADQGVLRDERGWSRGRLQGRRRQARLRMGEAATNSSAGKPLPGWAVKMETMGIEPTTPALQRRCSPN